MVFNRVPPFVPPDHAFFKDATIGIRARRPTRYSWQPSAALVNQSAGGVMRPDLGACLPPVELDRSNNNVTYLCHQKIYRAVSKISGRTGRVYEKTDWITSILPGKLGNGKNAGG
jgi:hypothetical protein